MDKPIFTAVTGADGRLYWTCIDSGRHPSQAGRGPSVVLAWNRWLKKLYT